MTPDAPRTANDLRLVLENGIKELGGTMRSDLARGLDDLVHLAEAATPADSLDVKRLHRAIRKYLGREAADRAGHIARAYQANGSSSQRTPTNDSAAFAELLEAEWYNGNLSEPAYGRLQSVLFDPADSLNALRDAIISAASGNHHLAWDADNQMGHTPADWNECREWPCDVLTAALRAGQRSPRNDEPEQARQMADGLLAAWRATGSDYIRDTARIILGSENDDPEEGSSKPLPPPDPNLILDGWTDSGSSKPPEPQP